MKNYLMKNYERRSRLGTIVRDDIEIMILAKTDKAAIRKCHYIIKEMGLKLLYTRLFVLDEHGDRIPQDQEWELEISPFKELMI